MSQKLILLAWLALAASAPAQTFILPESAPKVNRIFDSPDKDALDCQVRHNKPSLDFMFRHDAGYWFSCRLRQFESPARLAAFIRITAKNEAPVLMGEVFDIPEVSPEVKERIGAKRWKKAAVQASGAFAMGEGEYSIEILLVDARKRTFRDHWKIRAEAEKGRRSPLALQPHTVAPLVVSDWDGKLAENGVRLTVLLHATPMFPTASRLYAWDRAFLLQSLTSLLKQTPCKSVRVIAFNLDQQREIFREDEFGPEQFDQLIRALRKLELGTVSYKALQKNTWAELLVDLAQEQTVAKESSDAVVFLGPSTRFWDKIPREMMRRFEKGPACFFYFEYYAWPGSEFPDAIDHLTHDLNGTVFRIHSADDLRQAIPKMLAQIKPEPPASSLPGASN